jgi:hypothetical protein
MIIQSIQEVIPGVMGHIATWSRIALVGQDSEKDSGDLKKQTLKR